MSSISLFEGLIDKSGLGPFAKEQPSHPISAFTTNIPIAIQKTFIFPKQITAISHTKSENGLANKNLILSFSSNQVMILFFFLLLSSPN